MDIYDTDDIKGTCVIVFEDEELSYLKWVLESEIDRYSTKIEDINVRMSKHDSHKLERIKMSYNKLIKNTVYDNEFLDVTKRDILIWIDSVNDYLHHNIVEDKTKYKEIIENFDRTLSKLNKYP